MSTTRYQPTSEPTLAEVLDSAFSAKFADIHTCIPGIVVSYDSSKSQVDVQLGNKLVYESYGNDDPVAEAVPIIPGIPVLFPGGGGITLSFPLKPGDNVLIVFSESDINNFRGTNTANNDPGILQRFGLSGAMAIPCNIANKSYSGKAGTADDFAVINASGNAEFVALANLVASNLQAISTLLASGLTVANATPAAPGPVLATGTYTPTNVAATKLKSE